MYYEKINSIFSTHPFLSFPEMSKKASTFRVSAHPIIQGLTSSNQNPWAWLHTLSIQEWEELIELNMDEKTDDDDMFFVVKPGTEDVLDCPREIALAAYQDVLAGKSTPAGPGPLSNATVKKLVNSGGTRMRAAASESFM